MKKGDWVVILDDSITQGQVWSYPQQLDANPVMGWKTGSFSQIFISAEAFPQIEKELGKPSLFYDDPRVIMKRGFGELRWIPANRVRPAKKSDFDPLIKMSLEQQKRATKDKIRFEAARRRVKFV